MHSDARMSRGPQYKARDPKRLTPREKQIVVMIADGLSNKEIAARLNLAVGTVKVYNNRLMRHTGLNSRLEIARAVLTGVLPVDGFVPLQQQRPLDAPTTLVPRERIIEALRAASSAISLALESVNVSAV